MVEILETTNEGIQRVVGRLFLSGGKVVLSNKKLEWILKRPCYLSSGKEVTAESSPIEWLNALPANYSGTRLRARKVG